MVRQSKQPQGEPVYEVVAPIGKKAGTAPAKLGRPVSDLAGKKVAELWDYIGMGQRVYPLIREEIKKRFPGVEVIPYQVFGNTHGAKEKENITALPDKLREAGAEVVISGLGV